MLVAAALPATGRAQAYTPPADSTKPADKPADKPAPPKPVTPQLDFSGVVFGNYQYQGAAGATKGQNKFDVERAYLTFKMPAGEHASIRVTGDLFQQTSSPSDAYYKGWVLRAKYAYLQYITAQADPWSFGKFHPGIFHGRL